MSDLATRHFAKMNPIIFEAINNNKEDYMKLINKIRVDMGEALFKPRTILISDDENSTKQLSFPDLLADDEDDPRIADDPDYNAILNMLTMVYVASFMVQQIPDPMEFEDLKYALSTEGTQDGQAYNIITQFPRH